MLESDVIIGLDATVVTSLVSKGIPARRRAGDGDRPRRVQLDQKSATNSFFGALAGKKLVRFQEYAALYPEATFVFVGDNGQVLRLSAAGLRMLVTISSSSGERRFVCGDAT
jgi:hypothetical protein